MFTAELPDNVNQILLVHHSLWNHTPTIKYGSISYPTYTPSHEGYTSVILPNDNAKNFLWITQNLNKSSYATSEITKAQTLGHVKRITWIVDNNDNKFSKRISRKTKSTGFSSQYLIASSTLVKDCAKLIDGKSWQYLLRIK